MSKNAMPQSTRSYAPEYEKQCHFFNVVSSWFLFKIFDTIINFNKIGAFEELS